MSGSQMMIQQLMKSLGIKVEPAQLEQLVSGIMAMVPQFQADYMALRTQAPVYLRDVTARLERIERKLDGAVLPQLPAPQNGVRING